MDFTKLETIVSSRKLPQSTAVPRKKKRLQRRVTPVPVATTTTALSGTFNVDSDQSPQPLSTAESNTQPAAAAAASYNTTIGFLESRMLVKQRFQLSDSLYVLLGLDIDVDMKPTIYIVDKRLWLQLEVTSDCLYTISYYQQRLHDFYANATPGKPCISDGWPVYTDKVVIKPSMESEFALSFTRNRSRVPEELEYGSSLIQDWEQYACWNNIDDYPVPSIQMTQEEWISLSLQMESIIEYSHLCTPCKPAALRLVEKYVSDFKLLTRPVAVAANLKSPCERAQARDDIGQQLPQQVRNHRYTRLIIDTSDYDRGINSPFGAWLDAEVRAHCNQLVTAQVIDELSKEFAWLKITD